MSDENAVVEKRGPGRPPKQDFDELTYIPRDPGDPSETVWNGIKFRAHLPVKIAKTQAVLVPIRQESQNADGNVVSKSPERKVAMAVLARDNPYFSVNGEAPVDRKEGKLRTPTDADQYRGYAYGWITIETNADALEARWKAEEALREECGVDQGELVRIMPFYDFQLTRLRSS